MFFGLCPDNTGMQQELFPLPNLNSKILRSNVEKAPEYLLVPFFKGGLSLFDFLENAGIVGLKAEEIDILIIMFHLFFTDRKNDGFLYFNTDDILIFRGVRKNKALKNGLSGYKKIVRQRIDAIIKNLGSMKIFTVVDYKDFNYVVCFYDKFIQDIDGACFLSQKLLALNPHLKSWHKSIGMYLSILKSTGKCKMFSMDDFKTLKHRDCAIVQVKKLLKLVSLGSLFPFQIRNRFEDVLDELCQIGIIQGWSYKNIDEEMLCSKNWLFFWRLLSIKVAF